MICLSEGRVAFYRYFLNVKLCIYKNRRRRPHSYNRQSEKTDQGDRGMDGVFVGNKKEKSRLFTV